ncbi:hypothetical protein [Methylovirgula sp. 4M-Z18]|uniref:hypothetical protein n=1 Tax=Methylovirgula sp. 4M-Z18 TaxID=2293567 RepID=UPI000E2F7B88|nr:hypothetical protein [Methylovirgula sp. 4M-Z18]RFB80982.1 hypothetical protein DYH55_05810 [Methylovirgula sp. 4M-Z18]
MSRFRVAALSGVALAVVLMAGVDHHGTVFVSAAQAQTANVALDNVTIKGKDNDTTVTYKHIEFQNTNLSQDDVTKLFSSDTKPEDRAPLLAKLQASKILIPETTIDGKDGKTIVHDFIASNVDKGVIANLTIAGADGSGSDGFALKAQPLTAEGVDLASILAATTHQAKAGSGLAIRKLSWGGADITAAQKDVTAKTPGGNMLNVKIGQVDMANTVDGAVFRSGQLTVASVVLTPPKDDPGAQQMSKFGYDKIEFSLKTAESYDPATKKLSIDELTVSGPNAGTLSLKANLGNIDHFLFDGDEDTRKLALASGDFSDLTLNFVNNGLFDKAIVFAAQQQGKSPDDLKKQLGTMAQKMLPMMMGGSPDAVKLGQALSTFIAQPKSLNVSIKAKEGALPFAEIAQSGNPMDVLNRVDLNAAANQ